MLGATAEAPNIAISLGTTVGATSLAATEAGGFSGTFTSNLLKAGGRSLSAFVLEIDDNGLGLSGTTTMDFLNLVNEEITLSVKDGTIKGLYETGFTFLGTRFSKIELILTKDQVFTYGTLAAGLLANIAGEVTGFIDSAAKAALAELADALKKLNDAKAFVEGFVPDIEAMRETVLAARQILLDGVQQTFDTLKTALDSIISQINSLTSAFNSNIAGANSALSSARSAVSSAQSTVNGYNNDLAALKRWYDRKSRVKKIIYKAEYETRKAALKVLRAAAQLVVEAKLKILSAAQITVNSITYVFNNKVNPLKTAKQQLQNAKNNAQNALNAAKQAMLHPETDPVFAALLSALEDAKSALKDAADEFSSLENLLGKTAQIASYIEEFGLGLLFNINSAVIEGDLDLLESGSLVNAKANMALMEQEPEQKVFPFDLNDPTGSFKTMSTSLHSGGLDSSVDTTPPEITGTAPSGWQNSSVSVGLKAIDNVGGSGVASIAYSSSGAQVIPITTIPSDTVSVLIGSEGKSIVSFYATDVAGNIGLIRSVTVKIDLTPPDITTSLPADGRVDPDEIIQITATDDGGSGLDFITFSTSGDEVIPEQTVLTSTASLSLTITGETYLSITATDKVGNSTSLTLKVLVKDIEPPVITAPEDIIAFEATGPLSDVEIGTATATDNVGVVLISSDAPAAFSVGDTIVTWTAADAAGNTASATQRVSVVDTTPPELTVPDDIDDFEATGPLTFVPLGSATASDVVGVISLVNDAPPTYPVGFTFVTWTASDAAGNSTSEIQVVTVVDTTPPAITLSTDPASGPYYTSDNITVIISVNDLVDPGPEVILTHSSRGNTPTSISPGDLDPFMHAGQNIIILTATDMYGNSATTDIEFEVILKVDAGGLIVNLKALKVNPGKFTVFAVFPEPYNAMNITSAEADGAGMTKIIFAKNKNKAVMKFSRSDIDPSLMDTQFEITGTFMIDGKNVKFTGSDTINKVHYK